MTTLTNSFEGGTQGTTVTAANSGGASGSKFDNVSSAGTTLAYDNTHAAHGVLSMLNVTGASLATNVVQWTTSLTATTIAQAWFRCYAYLTAYPSNQLRVARALNSSTYCGGIAITAAGNVVTLNTTGGIQTTSTNVVPLNQWFRLEGYVIGSASAGQIQVQLYLNGDDAATPTETNTSGAAVNTASAINKIDFGNPSSSINYTFWMDDVGASSTGYIGPVASGAAGSGADIVAALIASGTI